MRDLNQEELNILVNLLKRVKPGTFPLPLFIEFTRLLVSVIVEIVPLRTVNNKVEVLLLKRPEDDPIWPNLLHNPGTVVKSTDFSLMDATLRVFKDELEISDRSDINFVEFKFRQVKRGKELALIYWIELDSSNIGEYFNVSSLPSNVIDTSAEVIEIAASKYRLEKSF